MSDLDPQHVADTVKELLQEAARIVAEVARLMPDHISKVGIQLAKRGWYMCDGMNLGDTGRIGALFESGSISEIDEAMAAFVRARIPGLEELVRARYPKRLPIVNEVIRAHGRGDYAVAIPTILCQAEGICIDLLNTKLYATKDKIPLVSSALEPYRNDDYIEAFLSPLETDAGIVARQEIRKQFPDVMNRHEIIHGIDTGYATEMNSLKAISLFDYIATMIWAVAAKK